MCHCATPVYTSACAFCLSTRTPVCVRGSPRPWGRAAPHCSWGGARSPFLVPGSPFLFPVPHSWFPVPRFPAPIQPPSRDHLALGDGESMARKEPLLSALKGEPGAPRHLCELLRAALRYRSDRTDGGAALGLPGPAPPPDLGLEELHPSSCPARRRQPGRAVPCRAGVPDPPAGSRRAVPRSLSPFPGCRTPPGAVQSCPPVPVPFPCWAPTGAAALCPPPGAVLRLREGGGPCTDASPHLVSLCQLLESILRKGLRQPAWGFRRRDYWHWLEQLPAGTGPSPLSGSIRRAAGCERARTARGRGRCFLRSALQGKALPAAVGQLAQSPRLLEFYDPGSSILGCEDLREPFLSLLLVLTEMDFSLDLQNCSFLDESWLLPVCTTYETVPCRALGMVLRYVDGRVFVTEVLPESQAEMDEVVLAGDILDEINGCSLSCASPGQAGAVLQRLKGQPLTLRLLRWRWHHGRVFEPLLPYLEALKEKEPQFQLQHSPRHRGEGEPRLLQGGRLLYNLRFLGQTSVGTYGGKEVLEEAIPAVLQRNLAAREVLFDVKEAEVLVQEKASSKLLCCHPYPSISCVGRCTWSPRIFAFCVVSSPESPDGSTFDCLVFAASSEQECEEIIGRIAAGFKHTEWFV
ncbi:uncharacterized protein LOC120505402 isoform X2 [Passer montanus]|uniref:uncharacterized protein LOC120505402 isoform X2 n=1 Tax=Passer montanus TaxID=9160 RepID=UPI0019611AAA|nr:uncharacterized protein LOC120505402 isoform X2 [Passer montanus]